MATLTSDLYRRLAYHPTLDNDYHAGQSGYAPLNKTLGRRMVAPGLYEMYVHANSEVIAWEGNRDVTRQYKLIRLRRQWTGRLSSGTTPLPIAEHYRLETASSGPRGFGPDYGPDSWVDAPGQKTKGRHPGNVRYLQEFISAVGHPMKEMEPILDFGGLYYLIAIDLTPDRYKVWMSLERRLLPSQVRGALGMPGAIFPGDVVWEGSPRFESERFLPSSWEEYAELTTNLVPHLSR
jgi:hypothetical protein